MGARSKTEESGALPPGVGKPATRALKMAGYTRLLQLTQVTEAKLLQLHGVGPKAIGILREALKAAGESFAISDKNGLMEGRTVHVRPACAEETSDLVDLMAEFYAESGYTLDSAHAGLAFAALLSDPRLGRVWLIEHDSAIVGYVVVTFVFGMEYGGLMAFVDDFFVRSTARNLGLGTAALATIRDLCAQAGVRAMWVEVGAENAPAQAVYRRTGFSRTDRVLMMLPLAAPSHAGRSSGLT
jgi:GNAT superfamily N-acetyltransferase